MSDTADVIIVGAGIAGVSLAARLAPRLRVIVLEAEPQPGYHATGRSAAFFVTAYGNALVRAVTVLSEGFYRQPPAGFSEVPLLNPREVVFFGRQDQRQALDRLHAEVPALVSVDAAWLLERVPVFAPGHVHAGLLDSSGGDLDVDAVLQGFLRQARHAGCVLHTGAPVVGMERSGGGWRLRTAGGAFSAPLVVNAAGAWADPLAGLAGLAPLGLQPLRRTAMLVPLPAGMDCRRWPFAVDVEEAFYFKPDAGQLLLSPADETPSAPCDAQAEEYDVALAVDRFEAATTLQVERVSHRWAGLRTFAPDKSFVVGFDPRAEGFFWLAGQGGYGVQSAPGLSALAAALLTGEPDPAHATLYEAMQPARLLAGTPA